MSLAVAVWESPTRYALAADSRMTSSLTDRIDTVCKVARRGRWLVAFAGNAPATGPLMRALAAPESDEREAVEAVLLAAFESALPKCGPTNAGEFPRTGGCLLLVGPSGVVEMDSYGCLFWTTGKWAFRAIGQVDFALGWMDCARRHCDRVPFSPVCLARSAVEDACLRYPGVGGPVDVLTAEGM